MKLRNMSHGIDYGYFGCFLGSGEFILDGYVISTFDILRWEEYSIFSTPLVGKRCMMDWGFIIWTIAIRGYL
jgi:hypothetical protein